MSTSRDPLRIRREYNQWVANETLEDYSLRYTAKRARRWSAGWVANTALGIVSFLALEAIGGTITLSYGFTNAMWAILVVGGIIFLSGLPLAYYAARDGVDIDLLTRGAGFGYIGSTISSLVYASFTFIFFALEAAIMSMAIHMVTDISLSVAYVISTIVVIPLATHGISRISRFQAWTQPLWLVLQIVPLVYIGLQESAAFGQWLAFGGNVAQGRQGFDLLLFGAAAAVIFPLLAQNGEQADFLRFLPEVNARNKLYWWLAVVGAGPGWVLFGIVKLFIGSFLAVLALNHGLPPALADDPAHMYAVAFGYIGANPQLALWLAGVFVVISQLKINVTNAYAGSIAWGNFFSRLTHSHPGRVVWLVFNVAIALLLMELGLYQAFETILITYASLVVAWVGSVVADLVINKPLGLSPRHIEFRRSHLYDINPVGVVSMFVASCAGIAANLGVFGPEAKALATFISLLIPFVTVPLLARLTEGRYYLCRAKEDVVPDRQQCRICENRFDSEDISPCPSYEGPICSLCCALDARCGDQCRPDAHLSVQATGLFKRLFPDFINRRLHSVTGHYLGVFLVTSGIIAGLLAVVFFAQQGGNVENLSVIGDVLWQVFFLLMLVTGVLIWLYVLAQKSTRIALREVQLQAELMRREVVAHEATAVELAKARDAANAANNAKSRYLSGVSHELRTPLNTIFGYARLMETDAGGSGKARRIASVIRRSSEHLSDVIEGLLEISKIEARKLDLRRDTVDLRALIRQLEDMFRPMAADKGIRFTVEFQGELPRFVTADEKRLRQILLNLLSNAIKFTPAGEVAMNISYRNQVARISVRDTGIGIAPEDQSRIFEPFERVRNDQTKLINGTGLGLSISRLLVEMMGGNLALESAPGQGTEFTLSLFLPRVAGGAVVVPRHARIHGYQGRRRHIMVVDDEDSHRELIHDFLYPLGFVVQQAGSAEQALEMLHERSTDLFLLDINMPGMDGWQLLKALRRRGFDQPVIVLSADPGEPTRLRQAKTAVQAYIPKPVHIEKLLEQLQRCLDLHWCETPEGEAMQGRGSIETAFRPGAELLDELERAAAVGYLKGVSEVLERLEARAPDSSWVKQLRTLTGRCDLDGVLQLVKTTMTGKRQGGSA
ncbi:MAG TPA: response regulator [Gammaproteobacteria bacterium]|nr:response regulator [Gammaproteobacteria bacterium]